MDEKDYLDKVKEHIELDKTLYKVAPEHRDEVKALLKERQKIMEQNGWLADFKLKRINKKIKKISQTYSNTISENSNTDTNVEKQQ